MSSTRVLLLISNFFYSAWTVPPGRTTWATKPAINFITYGNCPDAVQCPNGVINTSITVIGRNHVTINAEFKLTKRVYRPKAIAEFFKCYDREAITCEQYLRVPLDNICEFINAKNQFWTPVFQSFQPRFSCPDFVPGTYKLANGSFDLNELMKVVGHLPDSELYDFYWKQRLEFFNKRERLTCVYYVMKLDKVKANF